MFEKIFIATRGDQQPHRSAAAKPNCMTAEVGCKSNFAAENTHV